MDKTTQEKNETYEKLREEIIENIKDEPSLSDSSLYNTIDMVLDGDSSSHLSLHKRLTLRDDLFNSIKKLDILQELLDNPHITEIMINSPTEIFVELDNHIIRWNKTIESVEKLEDIIQQIVSRINRRVNTKSPIVDARLEDGSRVHIILPPIALKGPTITIRKFPEVIDMDKMLKFGTISKEAASFLSKLVRSGYNIFISGGTGSGKSTFLNALTGFIPEDERVITIEDSAELQIRHIPNLVSLETRDANSDGTGAITMSTLIKASLRMRPDRIIVGEVRGVEALDMLMAMNTGHDGSLSTGHANSTGDMLTRLETMVLSAIELPLNAVKSQIVAGLDILVHLARLPDKSRKLMEITEIEGLDEKGNFKLNKIFEYDSNKESLVKCGELKRTEKLLLKGEGTGA